MKRFAVYGPSIGNGSNARVADEICQALRQLGALEGFIATDKRSEDWETSALLAPRSLYIGNPFGMAVMHNGDHRERFVLLAPNSHWLPDKAVHMARSFARPVVPSRWAADVVRSYRLEPSVFPHSASLAFAPTDEDPDSTTLAHFGSGISGRKGTRELLEAFCDDLHVDLHVYVDDAYAVQLKAEFQGELHRVTFKSPVHGSAPEMANLYRQYSAVIQPSRGEAFGMVPLEARCCGRVAIMTACTGHGEHVAIPGTVVIETGDDAPLDDGPESMAPEVLPSSIAEAVARYEHNRLWYGQQAMGWANTRAAESNWARNAELWLRQIEGDRVP